MKERISLPLHLTTCGFCLIAGAVSSICQVFFRGVKEINLLNFASMRYPPLLLV